MDNQQPEKEQDAPKVIATPKKPAAPKAGPGMALWLLTLVVALGSIGLSVFLWQGDAAQQKNLQQSRQILPARFSVSIPMPIIIETSSASSISSNSSGSRRLKIYSYKLAASKNACCHYPPPIEMTGY